MVVSLAPGGPSTELLDALAAQLESGTVRVLDFVVVNKDDTGDIEIVEVELDALGGLVLDFAVPGLTGEEDIVLLAEALTPGGSAAIIALADESDRWRASRNAAMAESGNESSTSQL